MHVERRYKGERKNKSDFFWRIGGISPGFERLFLRLLFGGNQSTFQRRSEADFYGELEESVWVLKGFFEAAVWRKLIHVSEGILGLLFE